MINQEMTLAEAVEEALAGMDWLKPADDAMVQLVRKYAAVLDESSAPGTDPAVAVKALHLAPHMTRALEQLGGTPTARGEFREAEKAEKAERRAAPVEDTLARLTARAQGIAGPPVAEEEPEDVGGRPSSNGARRPRSRLTHRGPQTS